MKKIFTLLILTAGTLSFAAAQSYDKNDAGFKDGKKAGYDRNDNNAFDKNKSVAYKDSYFFYKQRMEQVNREFDQKIADVRYNRRLNGREKERQIKFLQMQRQKELDKLQHEFDKNNQQYKDKDKDRKHDGHW